MKHYILHHKEQALINRLLEEKKLIEQEAAGLKARLEQLSTLYEQKTGEVNGALSLIATVQGFDTSQQIELSADRSSLSGYSPPEPDPDTDEQADEQIDEQADEQIDEQADEQTDELAPRLPDK